MTAQTSAAGAGARGARPAVEERHALEARQARRAAAPPARPLTRRERREQERWRRRAGRPGRWGAPRTVRGRVLVLAVSAAALSAVLLVLAGWWGPSRASRPVTGAASAAAGVPTPGPAVEAPERVLQGLLDARATALRVRDPALLVRAESPGSSVLTSDAALLRRLLAAQQRYDGLTFAAHDVVVESRAGDRLVLRARVARSAYELVGADGSRAPQPGTDGTSWRYVLLRGPTGWRLGEVVRAG